MESIGRTVFWNVPEDGITGFYIIATFTILLFAYGFWSNISAWAKGKDAPLLEYMDDDNVLAGKGRAAIFKMIFTGFFSADCFTAKRVFERSKRRGIMLIGIMWSFIILFLGTVTLTLDYDLHLGLLKGYRYLVFSLILDIAGIVLLLGTGAALLRRYVFKPERILTYVEDGTILILLFLTVFLGFTVEGLRIAALSPPFTDWSPGGAVFKIIFTAILGQNIDTLLFAHRLSWILHFIFAFSFISYIPFSKQFHMFAAQITTKAASSRRY
jgi:nitrate reductase gamma subunit|tara:strand:+ start:7913 stop:8722 length:810 start_codon:yes stop_codon:yes gene_type:complete